MRFADVLTIIRLVKNKNSFLIAFFDLLLFFSIYLIAIIFGKLVPKSTQEIIYSGRAYVILVLTVYILLLIFVYSFFKFIILHFIGNFYKKKEFDIVKVGKFFLLNLVLSVGYIALFLIITLLLMQVIEKNALNYVLFVIYTVFILVAEAHINIAHSLYFLRDGIKKSLMKSAIYMLKFKKWIKVYAYDLILFIIFVIFYLASLLIRRPFQKFEMAYYIHFYVMVSAGVIFIYFLIFFNRIYFFDYVRKNVL